MGAMARRNTRTIRRGMNGSFRCLPGARTVPARAIARDAAPYNGIVERFLATVEIPLRLRRNTQAMERCELDATQCGLYCWNGKRGEWTRPVLVTAMDANSGVIRAAKASAELLVSQPQRLSRRRRRRN